MPNKKRNEFNWNSDKSRVENLLNLAKYYWTSKVAKCLYIALGGYLLLSAVSKLDDRVIAQDTKYATSSLLSWNNSKAILHGVSDSKLGKKSPTQSLFSETGKEIAITISDDNPNKPSNNKTISYKNYISERWNKSTFWKKNTNSEKTPTLKLEIDGETYEIFGDINSEFQVKKVMDTWEVLTFKVKGDRVTSWDFEGKDCDMWWSSMAYWSQWYIDKSGDQATYTYFPSVEQKKQINEHQDYALRIWRQIQDLISKLFLSKKAA